MAHNYYWKDIPKDSIFEVFRGEKAWPLIREGMPLVQDLLSDSLLDGDIPHGQAEY